MIGYKFHSGKIADEEHAKRIFDNPFTALRYCDLVNGRGSLNRFALLKTYTDHFDDGTVTPISLWRLAHECIEAFRRDRDNEQGAYYTNNTRNSVGIHNSVHSARVINEGFCARVANNGDHAQIINAGNNTQIIDAGDYTQIINIGIGTHAEIASAGNGAQISNLGNGVRIAAVGQYACIANEGDNVHITASGDGSRITSTGYHNVICCTGLDCIVSARVSSWITLTCWHKEKPLSVTKYVDGRTIKGDTPYALVDGEFVEVRV